MDKLLPLLPAVCALAALGFLVFILALCKTAGEADRWMDNLTVDVPDDGDYLGS
jgi:hypothetical protein